VWKAEQYRNSLIHEMLHAAFDLYACRCKYGCREKLEDSGVRWGGHDMPWMAAAHAIEQADKVIDNKEIQRSRIMGVTLELKLGKSTSLVCNWDYIPPDVELRRMGLNIKELREKFRRHREQDAKGYRKKQQGRQLMKANQCIRGFWAVDIENERYGLWNSLIATLAA
jgi:hypothetical protein